MVHKRRRSKKKRNRNITIISIVGVFIILAIFGWMFGLFQQSFFSNPALVHNLTITDGNLESFSRSTQQFGHTDIDIPQPSCDNDIQFIDIDNDVGALSISLFSRSSNVNGQTCGTPTSPRVDTTVKTTNLAIDPSSLESLTFSLEGQTTFSCTQNIGGFNSGRARVYLIDEDDNLILLFSGKSATNSQTENDAEVIMISKDSDSFIFESLEEQTQFDIPPGIYELGIHSFVGSVPGFCDGGASEVDIMLSNLVIITSGEDTSQDAEDTSQDAEENCCGFALDNDVCTELTECTTCPSEPLTLAQCEAIDTTSEDLFECSNGNLVEDESNCPNIKDSTTDTIDDGILGKPILDSDINLVVIILSLAVLVVIIITIVILVRRKSKKRKRRGSRKR